MTTVIIGAGLTGVSAGHFLQDDVIIIEKNADAGGLCSSYHINTGNHQYHIEKFYHHLFPDDRELIALCRDLNVGIEWRYGSVGYLFNNKISNLTTPVDILLYPHLTLKDKIKLAMFTLQCRKENIDPWIDVTAKKFIIDRAGESVYERFFLPLLRGKFGDDHPDITAAWLISRVKLRSNRRFGGERLGYVRGGFQQLFDALSLDVEKKGGKILKDTVVESVILKDGAVRGVKTNDDTINADNVICTSAGLANVLFHKDISYQDTVCALFSLKKKVTGVYWTNVGDELSFKALIEQTSFIPCERYGEHLVYAVTYNLQGKDIDQTVNTFVSDLGKLGVKRSDILWQRIWYEPYTAPLYTTGYRPVPYRSPVRGLFFAGIFSPSNYPERSLNGSVIAGKEVARLVDNG